MASTKVEEFRRRLERVGDGVHRQISERNKVAQSASEVLIRAKVAEDLLLQEKKLRTEEKELHVKEVVKTKAELEKITDEKTQLQKELKKLEGVLKKVANEKSLAEKSAQEKEDLLIKERRLREEFVSSYKEKLEKLEVELKKVNGEKILLETEIAKFCGILDEILLKQEEAESSVMDVESNGLSGKDSFPNKCFVLFSSSDITDATSNFSPNLKLGDGPLGSVYKGYIQSTPVAIKIIKDEFVNEQMAVPTIQHRLLLSPLGACEELNALVYDYQPNGSLADRFFCKEGTLPLTWELRAHIVTEICSALVFLHKAGTANGNLKLTNVLLDRNFTVKIVNFAMNLTGDDVLGAQYQDIYTLARIILQLLTGRRFHIFWGGKHIGEVRAAVQNKNLKDVIDPSAGEWPPTVAVQLAKLGLECWDAEDENVLPDLESYIESISKLLKDSSAASATPQQVQYRPREPPSHIICPICQEIMRDPQVAADGFTYEREAITEWFRGGHKTSPMTNLELSHLNLTPNRALLSVIEEWLGGSASAAC